MIMNDGATHNREHNKFDLNMEHWNKKDKPFGFSGCFRIRNDQEFMRQSIETHLEYLDEAILIIQPSDDKTEEIAKELAEKYEKVRIAYYPFIVHWIATEGHETTPVNDVYSLVHLSNWALTQCKYSWIVKTEADVICLSDFGKLIDEVKANPDRRMYYGRMLLNLAGQEYDLITVEKIRNHGMDIGVFPNHPDWHFTKAGKFETIDVRKNPYVSFGWSGLHVKRCKAKFKDGLHTETWLPFTKENVQNALKLYNAVIPYDALGNQLGEECLYEIEKFWRD